jgi:hypothetical protein
MELFGQALLEFLPPRVPLLRTIEVQETEEFFIIAVPKDAHFLDAILFGLCFAHQELVRAASYAKCTGSGNCIQGQIRRKNRHTKAAINTYAAATFVVPHTIRIFDGELLDLLILYGAKRAR